MSTLRRDVSYLKRGNFQDFMTITEVAHEVDRDISWIRILERNGRIPKAARVKRGQTQVRLWSPDQVQEIKEILATHKPGRPPGKSNGKARG